MTSEDYLRQAGRITAKAARLGLELDPVAEPDELDAIEQRLGVMLPASYRVFLTRVTGGHRSGPIPHDVCFYSLGESLAKNEALGIDLTAVCPLVTDLELLEFDEREPDLDAHARRVRHAQDLLYDEWTSAGSPAEEAWETSWEISSCEPPPDVAYWRALCDRWSTLATGTIEVFSKRHCGNDYRLAITGPSADQVWTTHHPAPGSSEGFFSLRVDILTYCERWFDSILAAGTWEPPDSARSVLEFGDNPSHPYTPPSRRSPFSGDPTSIWLGNPG